MPAAIFRKRLRTEGIKVMPRRQTSEKFYQYNKSQSSLLFVTTKNEQLFIDIKDDNGKLWVEVTIVTFFNQ